jgi:hypothetical protein
MHSPVVGAGVARRDARQGLAVPKMATAFARPDPSLDPSLNPSLEGHGAADATLQNDLIVVRCRSHPLLLQLLQLLPTLPWRSAGCNVAPGQQHPHHTPLQQYASFVPHSLSALTS